MSHCAHDGVLSCTSGLDGGGAFLGEAS
jgi:hypothetical protein